MSEGPRHEIPYLHVRPPRRVVGVGREGDPDATITGNRAGLLGLREQIDRALEADEGLAVAAYGYREIDGKRFDVTVQRATKPEEMGEGAGAAGLVDVHLELAPSRSWAVWKSY